MQDLVAPKLEELHAQFEKLQVHFLENIEKPKNFIFKHFSILG
jgi:hypothetical protein